MPAFLKGKESEPMWKRAKEIVKKEYGDIEKSDPDKFYATTTTIYKSLCTKHKCSPKKVSEQIKQLLLSSKPMQEDDIVAAISLYGAESPIQKGIDKAWALVSIFKKQPLLSKEKAEMRARFADLTKEMNAILKELES